MYQPNSGDNGESAEVGCGVFNRRVYFCAKQQAFDPADLIEQCYKCDRFYLMCCAHVFNQVDVCHSTRLIFTDGACLSNGHRNAQAGIGVAVGMCEKDQMAAPIDDRMDGVGKRTNQRAELLAALEGLKMMSRITPIDDDEAQRLRDQAYRGDPNAWVITTDSEYVVKGMTEWLPKWKRNGWTTFQGTVPSNLDLFRQLEAAADEIEETRAISVGFWHVPRALNTVADSLSKRGARAAAPIAF